MTRRPAGPAEPPLHLDDVPEQHWQIGELVARRRRLGAAAGAHAIGVAIAEVAPGARLTPPHSHADEDELFFVLDGDGLSWQSAGSRDVRTYRIGTGDTLFHASNGAAHTVIAGDRGLRILILAEGSRTSITYAPRTKQFWLGPRWSPADSPTPFQADAALGPLVLPEPQDERPDSIVAFDDCPLDEGGEGRFRWATRDLAKAAGATRLALVHDRLPASSLNGPRHWHNRREELFYVISGGGTAQIGDAKHPLRPGSFFLRPPASGIAHQIETGPDGIELLSMGDTVPGDVCVYPDSGKLAIRPGVFLPIAALEYLEGEPDATAPWPPPAGR